MVTLEQVEPKHYIAHTGKESITGKVDWRENGAGIALGLLLYKDGSNVIFEFIPLPDKPDLYIESIDVVYNEYIFINTK